MYLFYIDGVQLPVAPSKLQIKVKNQNKTVNLINQGEINILKMPGLTQISFTCLLPNTKYPFATYSDGYKPGIYYLDLFEKLKINQKVFNFNVIRAKKYAGYDYDTSFRVSLEQYTITEDVKDGIDFSVSIDLKQYKDYGTKIITFKDKSEATSDEKRPADNVTTGKKYTIVKGDSLWSIAKKMLGNGARYKEIYNANKDILDAAAKKYGHSSASNGWIFPGTVIVIP